MFKAPRPVPEIQTEYQNLCLRAGHLEYQIFALEKDLSLLNETLRELNLEASASQQAEKEAADKAAAEAAKPVVAEVTNGT